MSSINDEYYFCNNFKLFYLCMGWVGGRVLLPLVLYLCNFPKLSLISNHFQRGCLLSPTVSSLPILKSNQISLSLSPSRVATSHQIHPLEVPSYNYFVIHHLFCPSILLLYYCTCFK